MSETILIFDEAEAQAETQRQMRQTARMFNFDNRSSGAIPTPAELAPPPPREMVPVRVDPTFAAQLAMPPSLALPDHLLVTPTTHPGQLRLVRMQGAFKQNSWTLDQAAAETVAKILAEFGIQLTDLRESEDN